MNPANASPGAFPLYQRGNEGNLTVAIWQTPQASPLPPFEKGGFKP